MTDRRYRVAYLVTHPIQYQAPLLRMIAAQPDIDLTVFYQSDFSLHDYLDTGFGQALKWDVPLLGGYRHEFLPGIWRSGPVSALRPLSWALGRRLRRSRFDALWVHGYARLTNLTAMLVAKAHGLRVLVRDEATLLSAERSRVRRVSKLLLFKLLARVGDGFLAIGTSNRKYYLAQGVPPERIFDVPYCVDNEFFSTRARTAAGSRERTRSALALDPGRLVILFASKFSPRKRPQDLLAAYEQLVPRFAGMAVPYLLFVGDGELRASLEREARAKRLEGVKILGFRNQTELPALYDLCDVFVLPSVGEPWGLVVNEVMAAQRPVIVSDQVGCAPDLVKGGVNGFVFPAGDIEALTEALWASLADRDRTARMGAASGEIVAHWGFDAAVTGLRQALRATIR